jgi:hypothetical protein
MLFQVLLAKIEALESGKEGSGYEVQKKIQEYRGTSPPAAPLTARAGTRTRTMR